MSSPWPMPGELSVTFMWALWELAVSSNSSLGMSSRQESYYFLRVTCRGSCRKWKETFFCGIKSSRRGASLALLVIPSQFNYDLWYQESAVHFSSLTIWYSMKSTKLVIPLHFISWNKDSKRCCDTATPESIHTKDESKRGSTFAFIFGVNWPVQWM